MLLNNKTNWMPLMLASVAALSAASPGPEKIPQKDTVKSLPQQSFLFEKDPGFAQCHASTLIHLKNGEMMAAWFGGTKEGANDVGIWMTKGKPGQWQKPFEVAKIEPEAHWNPVLFQSPSGKIFLFFKAGKNTTDWETWVKTSEDEGKTWSAAYELVKGDHGGRGPVRNKPIILSDGIWIAGASDENRLWNAFFDMSYDGGKTWHATSYLTLDRKGFKGKGIIQPTLWEYPKGNVHALLRSSDGVVCRTDSKNYGKTWSPVYKTSLPNPNSAIDVIQLSDDTLALACNTDDKNWGSRGTLILALSFDNGNTWTKKIVIHSGKTEEEFSYPAMIRFGDTVAVTYTWQRKRIAFWSSTKEWILRNAVPMNQ